MSEQQPTAEQFPQVPPLITRAADPALRREMPGVVTAAVRAARDRQTQEAQRTAARPADARPAPVIPANLSALLGVTAARGR
jgi:hypothetical protein